MRYRLSGRHLSAALLACSGGAQVLAGVSGGLSVWESIWLAVTVCALFGATVSGSEAFEKTEECKVGRRGQFEKSSKVDVGRVSLRLKKALSVSRLATFRESGAIGLVCTVSR